MLVEAADLNEEVGAQQRPRQLLVRRDVGDPLLVVGREVDLAGEDLAVDAGAGGLGEVHGGVDGRPARPGDAVADHECHVLRIHNEVGGPGDLRGVAAAGVGDRPQAVGLGVGRIEHHVERQREEDGPRRRRERGSDRPAEHRRQRLDVTDLVGPLGELVGHPHEVAREDRFLVAEVAAVGARGHEHGRAGDRGRIEVSEPVCQSRREVQVRDSGREDVAVLAAIHPVSPLAVGVVPPGARVPRRHADRDVLVQAEDVLDVAVGQRVDDRQFGRPGVPEDVCDAGLRQRLDDQLAAGALRVTHARLYCGRHLISPG